MQGDARVAKALVHNLTGCGGPFVLDEGVEAWGNGIGFEVRGRVAGQGGSDVVILQGNRLVHAHASRVRQLFPGVQAVRLDEDDWDKTSRVLARLREKSGDQTKEQPGEQKAGLFAEALLLGSC